MSNRLYTRLGWHAATMALLLALALVFLQPALAGLDTRLVGGGGDAALECWTLCWNAHFLTGGAPSLFNANICHPEPLSLAYADHLFAQSLAFLPLYRLTGNQVLAFNLLLLLTLALNGFGAWLCGRLLGLSRPAALLAAVLFAFYPNRLFEVSHLHILSSQWLPFSFYFLLRFLRRERGGFGTLAGFTICSLLAVLSSFYQALFWFVLLLVTLAVSLATRRLGLRRLGLLAAAGLVIVSVTIPFARPYFEVSERFGVVRSLENNLDNSARPADFLEAPGNGLLYGRSDSTHQRPLFPGLLFILLLVAGAAALLLRGRGNGRQPPDRAWLILLITGATALILCFGPAWPLGGGEERRLLPLPYSLFYHFVPGIKGLRVPARLILLFHFCGALIAAYGAERLFRRLRPSPARAATLVACAVAFIEAVPARAIQAPLPSDRNVPPVYRALQQMPEDTVLLELPNHEEYYQFLPIYYSTLHFRPLANGRSGIIPPATRTLFRLIDPQRPAGLGPAFLDHALQTGINTILLHRSWDTPRTNRSITARLRSLGCVEPIGDFGNSDQLYRIVAHKGAEQDVVPIVIPVEAGGGPPVTLAPVAAFPSSLHRPMKMRAVEDRLALGESVHFRWLAEIPRGCWQLRLRADAGDGGEGPPVSITVEIAGTEVLREEDIRHLDALEGSPVRVRRDAHYRISCLVQARPGHRPIDVGLLDVRLERVRVASGHPAVNARIIN